jgi:hypothetical protein
MVYSPNESRMSLTSLSIFILICSLLFNINKVQDVKNNIINIQYIILINFLIDGFICKFMTLSPYSERYRGKAYVITVTRNLLANNISPATLISIGSVAIICVIREPYRVLLSPEVSIPPLIQSTLI